MAKKKLGVTTHYYLLNVVDDLIYNRVSIMGEQTIMTTTDRKECVMYSTIDEAVTARKEMGIETLNIAVFTKKITPEAIEVKKQLAINKALLNAM